MGLTDKHLAYGDDIPQTQTEKDYYWKIKHLEEQNNKLKEAIQKTLDHSCDDCISRQAVLDMINYGILEDNIRKLPPVTPKEKTGKWIDDANKIDAQFGRHTYICSECGKYAEYFISGTEVWWDRIKPNFCPNCGADMRGDVDANS